ncbi:MAG: S8 family serine peptidase [Bacteroidia bacterium]|nr:S8 family serine peptidase [Bacteroidia bacterium]NNJ83229.1 S8 family serine peptidase [Flavobacteriaceae bacterium]
MKKLMLFVIILITQLGYAQTQEALVFFADKENVAASIENPISILTQEAIDRKALHDVPIDERDVPVTESYITNIKGQPGITVFSKSKWMNAVYVGGTQSQIEDLLNLSFVIGVEFMDPDLNLFPVPIPVPDKYAQENMQGRIVYDYGAAANQIEMLRGDFLHEQDFTGEGMIIAVLDAGFPNIAGNPAFAEMISENRLLGTFDFVLDQVPIGGSSTHGAKVLSDMAGFLDGQFVGTAPEASYYLFRSEDTGSERPVEEAYWLEALERADSLGVDVVNTSLGYQDFDNPNYDHSYEDLDGVTTLGARAGNLAFDKGMLLVTSAGNDGNGFTYVGTPGDAPGILTIGAVNSEGEYASFSSIGPTVDGRIKPDVMAQGADAAVIDHNGNITTNNGTSLSSPIMAGVVACLWQSRPEARNYHVMQIVRESASLYNNPTDEMGYGIPNFEDAYNALQILGNEEILREGTFALYPNPASDILMVSFPKEIELAEVIISNLMGQVIRKESISKAGNRIDVSTLSAGLYLATVVSNGKYNTFKIVKQ